jgi:hypothetical protein
MLSRFVSRRFNGTDTIGNSSALEWEASDGGSVVTGSASAFVNPSGVPHGRRNASSLTMSLSMLAESEVNSPDRKSMPSSLVFTGSTASSLAVPMSVSAAVSALNGSSGD